MGLMLHAGSHVATRADVLDSPTPDPTETHFPIPHGTLVRTLQTHVESAGLTISSEEYGLWGDDDAMMFGVWGITNGESHDDYQLTIGIRNSHNKMFAAGMAVGSRVFVCDNLAFSAEIVIARKHTRHILKDLDRMVAEATGRIGEARIRQDRRIEAYKGTDLSDSSVHDLVIRAVDAKVMANSYIAKVLGEWRSPQHDEFGPRNAWSLFNSFTEVFKGTNPLDLPARTTRLHGLLDLATNAFDNLDQLPMDFGVGEAAPDFEGIPEADFEVIG